MAYLAMARKWRPRNFEEMVGQDHIAQTIRNAIAGKRISHAYLFTGTRGVGKTTSARILAKALNCKQGPTATPCDACENCKAVNAGSSMDVLEIDGASNNGVDNIRELREEVKYAPMHGTYKIYVIDEVHMLSKPAFNALLKTLEEPPPHVVFIFATTEVNKVPPTILSRVQRFDFKRISESRIRERLEYICAQEGIRPEREALEAVARKADGSMRDALSLFDQVYAFSGADLTLEAARRVLGLPREQMFDSLVAAVAAHEQKTCFDLLQEAHREGIETADLLVAFGEYLRNLLFARQGVSPAVLGLSDARHAELAALVPELREGDILRYAKIVSDLLGGLKTAANPRLSVELAFARMAALDRVVSLSQLLAGDPPPVPSMLPNAGASPTVTGAPPASTGASPVGAPTRAPAPIAPPADPEGKKKSPPEPLKAPEIRSSGIVSRHAAEVAVSLAPAALETLGAVATALADAPEPARPLDFEALPEARSDAPAAAPRIEPAASPADEEETDPASEELDYSEDPEDPDMQELPPGPLPVPHPRPGAREEGPVPQQPGPEHLPRLWPALVDELMATRPLLATHLRLSRLEWEREGSAGLTLVFLDRAAYSLLADDGDFRKSILAFLTSKLSANREFPLRHHLDEAAAASAEPVTLATLEEARADEPILSYIRRLFEGRSV